MSGKLFPEIISLREIQSLSFWRFVRMRSCMLSGAYPSSTECTMKPKPLAGKAQILGQIYHLALETFHNLQISGKLSRESLRKAFFNILSDEENKARMGVNTRHLTDISSWPEIGDVYDSVLDLCERATVSGSKDVNIYTENTLYSNDRNVFGQIDAYFIRNGTIDLVDYKSGKIEDQFGVKADYVDQLYFYAYLIDQNHGIYPAKLALKSKDYGDVEICPDPQKSVDVANQMKALLESYNQQVQHLTTVVEMARPSQNACSNCDAKVLCPSFWSNAAKLKLPNGKHVVRGKQIGELKKSTLGGSVIELEIEQASFDAKRILLTRVFEARYPEFKSVPDQRIIATSLKITTTENQVICELNPSSSLIGLGDPNGPT